jgi:hypothetical protein
VCCRCTQAISILRAKLSYGYDPSDPSKTNDQNIIADNGMTPILVPSNGYTFPRNPQNVSALGLDPKPISTPYSALALRVYQLCRCPFLASKYLSRLASLINRGAALSTALHLLVEAGVGACQASRVGHATAMLAPA